MRRCFPLWLILLLAFAVACGTAKGRYDGEDLDDSGDKGGDDQTDDDDQAAPEPEIDNFSWVNADGETVRLHDFLGKVVLLNTAAFWCEPCREETPSLQADIWERYRDEDFALIQLVVEDGDFQPADRVAAAAWREQFGLTYTVCADPDWSLEPWFQIDAIPFNLLLDRHLQIVLATHEYDKDFLSLLIEDML